MLLLKILSQKYKEEKKGVGGVFCKCLLFHFFFSEGYEKLLHARGESTSISAGQGYSTAGEDVFSSGTDTGIVALESAKPSTVDEFDIFAEDDENTTSNPSSNGDNMVSRPYSDGVGQPISNTPDTHTDSKLFFFFFLLLYLMNL